MSSYWIGLDIGGTKCAVLLATVNHGIHIEDKIRFATCRRRALMTPIAAFAKALTRF